MKQFGLDASVSYLLKKTLNFFEGFNTSKLGDKDLQRCIVGTPP